MSVMENCESLAERQENEMQALKAIFGPDLRDMRENDTWKVRRPLECTITLKPQQGSNGQQDVYAQIDLHVLCSDNYPNEAPSLTLENSRGLSERHVEELKVQLESYAARLVGEVMIFELAQHVQNFLHGHNKPGFQSFYEEMLSRQREERLQQQEEMKQLEDRKRQAIQGEIERRKEILRKERLCKGYEHGDFVHEVSPTDSDSGFQKRPHSLSESSSCSSCDHKGPLLIEFSVKSERKIRRGQCLGHSPRGSVVFSGMDTKTGQLFILNEWILRTDQKSPQSHHRKKAFFNDAADLSNFPKLISSVEQEFNYLQKLHHSNLVHYISIKCIPGDGFFLIYLLQEFVFGSNLTFYLSEKLPVDTDMLRHITSGILEALEFLHQSNVVHKDLRGSCVFLTQTGLVRVSDYSLDKRLLDAYQTSIDCKKENTYPPSLGRGGKKSDIHRLGILLLSLISGHIITESMPEIPKALPPVLKDFLHKCLVEDEHQRWSAHQLLKHQFINTKVASSLILDSRHSLEKDPAVFDKSEDFTQDFTIPYQQNYHSRIHQEFELMKLLGRGSFGNVYKARNKLDGGIYAIKRIELDPKNRQLNRKITREVKLLSRLNHENVVRYYNSWIESATIEMRDKSDKTVPSPIVRNDKKGKQASLNFLSGIEKLSPPGQDIGVEWSVSQSSALPESDSSDDSSDEDWVHYMSRCESSDGVIFENDSPNKPPDIPEESVSSTKQEHRKMRSRENSPQCEAKEFQFMYIQMEFCEKSTLRSAIDDGLNMDVERMWRLFREIVEGLAHIHQQGMIHRDLKPVNIFLDSKDHVKIGDFGLATVNVLPRLFREIVEGLAHIHQQGMIHRDLKPVNIFLDSKDHVKIGDFGLATVNVLPRLFREIVEGLAHIHQQGMIHRDLKPVNIFLDSKDHVKIGDFGLATVNVLPRPGGTTKDSPQSVSVGTDSQSFSNDVSNDLSLTGQVGTALYVAPELTSATGVTIYNQKVDIYSLGIIFFEMCLPPWETAMERVKVLMNLRTKDIVLPQDFVDEVVPQKVHIIRWLLNHDPSQRPTSMELLQSDYVPPPQVEEAALQEMVRHTLSEPQSKTYKYLIASCFKQEVDSAGDITYDMNLSRNVNVPLTKTLLMQNHAKETAVRVFQRHGAVSLSTSLLMPKNQIYDAVESSVNLMTHSGGIVSLPHDLRVVFARHIAYNSITDLKWYAVEKVYREKKLFGFHPREYFECSFDIVSSQQGSLLPEAELLFVVWEFLNEFQTLRDITFTIHLNHTALIRAILLHLSVEESKHSQVYSVLNRVRLEGYSKVQKGETRIAPLLKLGLSDSAVDMLYSFIENEIPVSKVSGAFRFLVKRKSPISSLAKQALDDLEKIATYVESLGLKCSLLVAPGMLSNIHLFSGTMCQFVCELKKKRKKIGMDVIAAGGRYDGLVSMFRQRLEEAGMPVRDVKQCAVGISIALDKIILALQEENLPAPVDAIVCSVGNNPMLNTKATLARDLWAGGIKTLLMDGTQDAEEIQNYCVQNKVKYIVLLKSSETGIVKVRILDKDRFQERKLPLSDVVDAILKAQRCESSELVRSDSKSTDASSGVATVNISFSFSLMEKLNATSRRRLENQVISHITPFLNQLSPRAVVEVLLLNVEIAVIKTLASSLDFESDQEFQKSVSLVFERPTHHNKKNIRRICDEIRDIRLKSKTSLILLYSSIDGNFKALF